MPNPMRLYASLPRSRNVREHEVEVQRPFSEIEHILAYISDNGIPDLPDHIPHALPEEAQRFMDCATTEDGFKEIFPYQLHNNDFSTQQAILHELVVTEAQYINHLIVVVDVYIATAHSLQSCGFLLDIDTWMVFSHLPDILNSAMKFWEYVIYPMLHHARKTEQSLNPAFLIEGFLKFPELFAPYEDYVLDQTATMDYFRNMQTDPDFVLYINWCNQRSNNRLQLNDILIKPMQRLTKYNLLLGRLVDKVKNLVAEKLLRLVDRLIKSNIVVLNRSISEREELTKIAQMRIEPYEPDYMGDEELEKACKPLAFFNLHLPMLDCGTIARCLIHSGVIRYKDSIKEFDAHVLIFTDMMLICKKLPKLKEKKEKGKYKREFSHWKMLRPKIMLSRLIPTYKPLSTVTVLSFVIVDELGGAQSVFQLTMSSKSTDHLGFWEMKIFEAMTTNVLTKWYVKHPPKKLDIIRQTVSTAHHDVDKPCSLERDPMEVEMRARERVVTMLNRTERVHSVKEKYQIILSELKSVGEYNKIYKYDTQTSDFCSAMCDVISSEIKKTEEAEKEGRKPSSFHEAVTSRRRSSMVAEVVSRIKAPGTEDENRPPKMFKIFRSGNHHYNAWQIISSNPQTTVLSSANSSIVRSSSEVQISGESHEDAGADPVQRSGSAMEPSRPEFLVEDLGHGSPAIKVDMVPENDNQTLQHSRNSVGAPNLVLEPKLAGGARCASAGAVSDNTLQVASAMTQVHSMPDINDEIRRLLDTNLEPRPVPNSVSERLYRSHQELLKNRLAAGHHFLKPDQRGSSYPPPSPRALQRGDAVSFSSRFPPLMRTKNVTERASTSLESIPPSFARRSPAPSTPAGAKSPRGSRSPSPIPRPVRSPMPEKKKFLRRRKKSQFSPERDGYDADDDVSCSQEKGKSNVKSSFDEGASCSTTEDGKNGEASQSSSKKKNKDQA